MTPFEITESVLLGNGNGIAHLAGDLLTELRLLGVETPAQRERLIAFGCELGQGFLFAEPLEPAAASALLESADPVVPA
jgi:EAL domain-containing protein (putative c-di-GMP-specific phosphodiesterase class I)